MDISAFMTGYFVGMLVGISVFALTLFLFGNYVQMLRDAWKPFIAKTVEQIKARRKPKVEFNSRRKDDIMTPAE